MSEDDTKESVEEAKEYYRFVSDELNKRNRKLQALKQQAQLIEEQIVGKKASKKSLLTGQIGSVISDNADRGRLLAEKVEIEKLELEVVEDINRALERLEIAEEDLSSLGVKIEK